MYVLNRYVLNIDETLLEALEDNSMQLQNLMGSKYVQVASHSNPWDFQPVGPVGCLHALPTRRMLDLAPFFFFSFITLHPRVE